MPTRVPSPGRVRDNQRRSRARRREYIQELEEKLRRLERNGVKVTTEVQSAAKKVVRENGLLRSLLNERGIANDFIDAYLKGSSHSRPGPALSISMGVQGISGPPAQPQMTNVPFCAGGGIVPLPYAMTSQLEIQNDYQVPWLSNQHSDASVPFHCPNGQCTRCVDLKHSVANRQKLSNEPLYSGSNDKEFVRYAEDTTSCALAAQIISSMRGHDQNADVWTDLGCTGTIACTAKNTTVFQVMDRCG